jgi:hypothetical protein
MIVYFSKKSKETYIRWGTGIVSTLIGIYIIFVWGRVLTQDVQTLQISRNSSSKTENVLEKENSEPTKLQEGDYAFVASKKGQYYYPKTCNKAKTLSAKNMLYFKDKISAEGAGFKAYLGCK